MKDFFIYRYIGFKQNYLHFDCSDEIYSVKVVAIEVHNLAYMLSTILQFYYFTKAKKDLHLFVVSTINN